MTAIPPPPPPPPPGFPSPGPMVVPAPARRLSISSLLSFICGLLGCVPFATGALAVLLGIVGLVRTGGGAKSGRWMAIIGLVLGILSIGGWTLFGGAALALWKGTEGPRIAAHDFIRDVAAGNDVAAKAETTGMSDEEYDQIAADIRMQGKFVDTTFFATNIVNDSASVEGIASFDAHTATVSGHLEKAPTWKVSGMTIESKAR